MFNCYLLAVITTSRKLFSVVLSNFWFNHGFNERQWMGSIIVMICTFSELLIGKKNKDKESDETAKETK